MHTLYDTPVFACVIRIPCCWIKQFSRTVGLGIKPSILFEINQIDGTFVLE